jgi:hypothetical protein
MIFRSVQHKTAAAPLGSSGRRPGSAVHWRRWQPLQERARGVPDRTVVCGASRSLTGTPRGRSPAAGQFKPPCPQSLQAGVRLGCFLAPPSTTAEPKLPKWSACPLRALPPPRHDGRVMIDSNVLIGEFGDAAAEAGIEGWPCLLRSETLPAPTKGPRYRLVRQLCTCLPSVPHMGAQRRAARGRA